MREGLAVKEPGRTTGSRITGRPERSQRRRRPSGEPEPLPRQPLAGASKFWLMLALLTAFVVGLLLSSTSIFLGSGTWWNDLDEDLMRSIVDARAGWVPDIAVVFDAVRSAWLERAFGLGEAISVSQGTETLEGRFSGLDEHGALLLEHADGKITRILAADIELRP